jgi:hypothetical protein
MHLLTFEAQRYGFFGRFQGFHLPEKDGIPWKRMASLGKGWHPAEKDGIPINPDYD